MAVPRLKGVLLTAAVKVAETEAGRKMLYKQLAKDFRMDEISALASTEEGAVEAEPRPTPGEPPRLWSHAELAVPETSRPTSRKLRHAYRDRSLTPTAVLAALRTRIESADFGASSHSPFVAYDWERAADAAAQSSKRYADAAGSGYLDGIPVPLKDQHHVAGLPTGSGTWFATEVERDDADVVRRLRDAGALIYAKTAPTEFGMDPCGMNPNIPMPRNIYKAGRAAGGSSTGSGVAVGLGFATVASGSDGGGSIRIPSAHAGVFGLKPTFGRISATGNAWTPSTMGHTGPIGQSTCDLVDFLAATHGADPLDSYSQFAEDGAQVAKSWRKALGRGVKGAKIGILRSEWAHAPEPLRKLGFDALAALEAEGATLVDVEIGLAEIAPSVGSMIIAYETSRSLDKFRAEHRRHFGGGLRLLIEVLLGVDRDMYDAATSVRGNLRLQVAAALRKVDVLALPTLAGEAARYPLSETGVAISDPENIRRLTRFAFLANLTGVPAGTVPVGMHDGLPVAVQFIGDAFDEASVLALMAHCERLRLTDMPRPQSWFDICAAT